MQAQSPAQALSHKGTRSYSHWGKSPRPDLPQGPGEHLLRPRKRRGGDSAALLAGRGTVLARASVAFVLERGSATEQILSKAEEHGVPLRARLEQDTRTPGPWASRHKVPGPRCPLLRSGGSAEREQVRGRWPGPASATALAKKTGHNNLKPAVARFLKPHETNII